MIEELKPHIRDYLVERKCEKMLEYIDLNNVLYGCDTGCGMGHHVRYFRDLGFKVVGVDLHNDIADKWYAKFDMRNCYIGFATSGGLVFSDFLYTINVLHHLPSREDQLKAIREAHRILRPGGLFFIHELNFRNFFIGLYVKYIFRHFRNIDQGNECWFDPKLLKQVPEFKLIAKEYFTFTPDFCPRWLLPLFKRIDEWSDGRWIARFGAHVMYVLEKK